MRRKNRTPLAAVLRILGVFLLAALAAVCLPLTVPRLFGYQIYAVVSGSMEPAIPTGSLVYIRGGEPAEVQEGEVIAFYGTRDRASVVTHRVTENRMVMGEFVTKGDANAQEDMNPVPYADYIGSVVYSIPWAGILAELITSPKGKGLAAGAILAAVLLQMLAALAEGVRSRN